MSTTENGRDPQPALTGRAVRLRPWRADDVDAVFAACQDAEIQRWTEVPVPYRREDAVGFVGERAPETWAAGGALFAVETCDGGALVGAMSRFPPRDGVGVGGYWTVAGHRGRGYTEEGTLRQRSIHRGHPVDDVIYGRLATDPRPKRGRQTPGREVTDPAADRFAVLPSRACRSRSSGRWRSARTRPPPSPCPGRRSGCCWPP